MKWSDWKVFSYTSIGVLLVFSNMTTMDVALPSIVRHFGASPTQANWILLGYMLTNTIMILAFGRLADILGRKFLYLAGMAVFTAASLGCGLSASADMLIFFRILQAVGGAAIVTNTTALLVDAYPAERMSLVLGMNVTVAAGSSICGPLIGGALVSLWGWRALFLAGVPLGICSLITGPRLLTMKAPDMQERFDLLGTLLSLVALGTLVFALSEGGVRGWLSEEIILCMLVALISGIAFVKSQLMREHPLVDLEILRNPDLVLAYYANFVMAVVQMSTLLLISLFVQVVFDMNALDAGIRITPLAGGLMASAPIAARLIDHVAPRHVAATGMGFITLGLICMSVVFSGHPAGTQIMAVMAMIGVGIGLFMTPNTTSIMRSVPSHRRGIANGLRSMVQNMGFVVGTAMSLAIVTADLNPVARRAVYSGQSALMTADQKALFHAQYFIVFLALAVLSVTAVLACAMRRVQASSDTLVRT